MVRATHRDSITQKFAGLSERTGVLPVATRSQRSRTVHTCWGKENLKQLLKNLLGRLIKIVPNHIKEGQSVAID